MARGPSKLELLLQDVPPPLRNKFILVTGLFVVWMFFFDNNSVISQFKLQSTRNELVEKLDYHKREIDKSEQDNRELLTDDKSREKFAREHYYMKKADEELFIIED
ncbi:MAG: septum formation initiator family protein [Aureispira sp.]